MQKLEGEFAEYYNLRKKRSGAFWEGRYWGTMVDAGEYMWKCMRYIDLNMVRAGVVEHPLQWEWCGYGELMGQRQRYRVVDLEEVAQRCGGGSLEAFRSNYEELIGQEIARGNLRREGWWTQSIAVGTEGFVKDVRERTRRRRELVVEEEAASCWTVRECQEAYEPVLGSEIRPKTLWEAPK